MLVLLLLSLELFKQVLNMNATQQMSSLYSLEMFNITRLPNTANVI